MCLSSGTTCRYASRKRAPTSRLTYYARLGFRAIDFGRDAEQSNYTQNKRGLPHLRTTSWVYPTQTLVIFPAGFLGLVPMEKMLIRPPADRRFPTSKEVQGLEADDIANLPLPRLAPLMSGLGRRYLDTHDDVSMIALEQLVDGMKPDEQWVQKNIGDTDPAVTTLIIGLVRDKKSRIDDFSENKVTCFVRNEEEAETVKLIPGLNEHNAALFQRLWDNSATRRGMSTSLADAHP
ncbi:hypothetical protein MFIFM68171_04828 [Madurella fahalii]|uniref:Uncharacterized protein n=1 Tax=Madurella fahalii TaxID=1157608 RepID=A0ABQ0GA30_9PEZI